MTDKEKKAEVRAEMEDIVAMARSIKVDLRGTDLEQIKRYLECLKRRVDMVIDSI